MEKTNVRLTSLIAYTEVIEKLGERQLQILKALSEIQPATNMMIAEYLGWSINRVTPRCLELRKDGIVELHSVGNCTITGRRTMFWRFNKK